MKYLIFGNKEKSKPSFKSEVFLCVNKELAIPSRSTEFLNRNQLGDINMCEVSVDGRFIVTLENKDQRTLKVWYNNYHKLESKICRTNSQKIMIAESQFQTFENDVDSNDDNINIQKQTRLKVSHDSNEIKLHSHQKFGENKNVQLLNREDDNDDNLDPIELEFYSLLNHNCTIVSFKLMMPDLFEGFKNATPTVLTTITEKGWIFLWYENLMDKHISFMCAHVFKPNQNEVIYDMAFLDFPPIDPKQYHALKAKKSGLFIPDTNKVSQIKRTHNNLGVYQNSYEGTTYDWVFLLKNEYLEIYRVEGLRNFPIKNINISIKTIMEFNKKLLPKVHLPTQILRIGIRDFNDKISFYGLNKSFQLIKYRNKLNLNSSNSEWLFKNILIAKRDIITDLIMHKDFPILLHKTITNELWFYFEEQSVKEIVKYNNFRFIGQYNHDQEIKQICFINKIPGIVILNKNNSITIVLSETFLKVLGSHKYSNEFLKIWDAKKNTSYEKWILADEYPLIDRNDDEVHGMQIISTHFDQCKCIIKILNIKSAAYSIFQISIEMSSVQEFTVKISLLSEKKFDFKISRFLSGNCTDNNIYHIFVECYNKSKANSLIKFKLDAHETNDHYSILWTSSILQSDKIRVVLSPQYLGILDDEDHILYIYDLIHEKYTGFIDLKLVFKNKEGEAIVTSCQECLLFGRNHSKGSLIVYYNDSILLFSQINLDSLDSIQDESWTLIHKFENILNISPINTIKMEESYYGKLMFIVNNKYFVSK